MAAHSLEPKPVHIRQVYFAIRSDVADKFKVKAAQERMTMKSVLAKLTELYVDGKIKIK